MLSNKKILITGLTGNLAGSIANALVNENELWGVARYSKEGSRDFWNAKGVKTVVADLADGNFVGLPTDFDYVIHAAANCAPETYLLGMHDNAQSTAMLMAHCQNAKAFLHISTVGVHAPHQDPLHQYAETDLTGGAVMGPTSGHYEGTKLAAEGVAWGMAKHLNLPTTVARLGVQYGTFHDGGMLGVFLKMMLAGMAIPLPKGQSNIIQPISDDDVVNFLEPLFDAASVPPELVYLVGDETIKTREAMEYFGELAGVAPTFTDEGFEYPTYQFNTTKRMAIAGPCQVKLKDGLTKLYDVMAPRIKAELDAAK